MTRLLPAVHPDAETTVLPAVPQEAPKRARRRSTGVASVGWPVVYLTALGCFVGGILFASALWSVT